jgi:predicted 2-oxoglutarate/Fe(II)-dependent dioxygenase YbiX
MILMTKRTKVLTAEQQAELVAVKASIRARLEAEGRVVGTVEAKAQSAWEKRVADANAPLHAALENGIAESPYNPDLKGVE